MEDINTTPNLSDLPAVLAADEIVTEQQAHNLISKILKAALYFEAQEIEIADLDLTDDQVDQSNQQ